MSYIDDMEYRVKLKVCVLGLSQAAVWSAARLCMEPVRRVRRWEACITTAASPVAHAVSITHTHTHTHTRHP